MKKIILISGLIIIFSAGLIYAENNIENNGILNPKPTASTKIEGTLNENIPANPSVRVSGIEFDCPSGQMYIPTTPPLNNSELLNPDDPTSNRTYPGLKPIPKSFRNESTSIFDGPRWGTDIRIDDKEVGEGQDFDEDEDTYDIYAVFDTYLDTNDSIIVYRSTDGGLTWNIFIIGFNADGQIGNPKVRVVKDAGGQAWVVFIGIWYEPSGARQLLSGRVRTDGTGATFEQIAPDNVTWADIDGEVGTGGWVYCTYCKEDAAGEDDIYAARNALTGTGWQDNALLFDDPRVFPYPAIAAGAGGNVAVAFIDDRVTTNQEIRIKRSTNYGAYWLFSEQVSDNSGGAPLVYTDIGYSHGTTQTGWIFATFAWSSDNNIAYYYSTNSGVNWTYGNVIYPASGHQNMSTVRCNKATGSITVAYNCDPGDSTMFTWTTPGNPTGFGNGVKINDYYATGLWPPTAGWITTTGGYSAIIYSSLAMGYRPYFDWFGNTGVEEGKQTAEKSSLLLTPNPSNGIAQLSYVLNKQGSVKISLYDASGRLVSNLIKETKSAGTYTLNLNNQTLPNGIYFVRVESPEGTATKTMTIVR
uniref:T9SS type A sorting domain-containing protein n=1 Tax=candidate division WOR-3 bacterium TaxID=2052148 RepID=A0A7V1EH07_UNCW3